MRILTVLIALLVSLAMLGCGDPDSPRLMRKCPPKADLVGTWSSTSRSYGINDEVVTLTLTEDGKISLSSSKQPSAVDYIERVAPWPCTGVWDLSDSNSWFCQIMLHLDGYPDKPGLYCDLAVLEIDKEVIIRYTEGDPDGPDVAVYFSKPVKR